MTSIPVTFILPDLGGGGAQKVMLSIAGALDRERFKPRLLVVGGSQAFAARIPDGLEVEIGPSARLRDGMPWLVRRIRDTRPAVCVSVMGYLNLMLLGSRRLLPAGIRLVIREANALEATTRAMPRLVPGPMLYRWLYPTADAIVSPTAAIAGEIAALAPAAKPRLNVIPNPVDVAGLRRRAVPPQREPGPGLRLVSVGRLTHQKGYDRLLPLLPAFPPGSRLTILGEGGERAALHDQAQRLGVADRVRFAGFSDDVAAWIAGADAFLLPSRWEGLPNVVLESLALGTPVIASREAQVAEVAAQTSAGDVLVRAVGPEFAEAVCGLEPRATPCGVRASRLPEVYNLERTVAAWNGLLAALCTSERAA